MSELKSFIVLYDGKFIRAYKESEADKVIEELKEHVKSLILDNYLKDKEIRHHKFKRCLAMAKWCFTKSNYHFVLARHGEDAKKNSRKSELYAKWHKRWLELADKFKEDK